MNHQRSLKVFSSLLTLTLSLTGGARAEDFQTDICVFGGTSGGIIAAVQSAKMGRSVVLVEPGSFLGGLTTGGLGATDIGNKGAIGGLSRDFYARIGKHYGQEEGWKFEPKVARKIYDDLIAENKIRVVRNRQLASVKKEGKRITEIRTANGDLFRAKMFIDATYEGDLMAKAGVSYHIGREANSVYQETLNGIREETPKHQFIVPVDPYRKKGDPSSGLLPFIQSGDGGVPGQGDRRLQAYNYRLCFTTNASNRMPVDPPPNYNPDDFELLVRYCEALVAEGKKPVLSQFWNPIWMPNQKTDINNNGGFSTDFIGANYDYPEADYATREKMAKAHENYIRGFITCMATHPRVPENLRREMKTWGPCRDEFPETAGWPNQLYVREARRMISEVVMTEAHCRGKTVVEDPVSLAAYNMDSHNCQRIVKDGSVENEGDVQVPPMKPYPISYRSIIPKASECENLLVPVCLSSSHIAYGSIRMEPVFMILGQSAATAASLALEANVPLQKVDYPKLKARLLADYQVLQWTGGTVGEKPAAPRLPGIVVDDRDGFKKGDWTESGNLNARKVGEGYVHDNNEGKGEATITFIPEVDKAGDYELFLVFAPHPNRASNVPVTVRLTPANQVRVKVDQRSTSGKGFQSLGRFKLEKGKPVAVELSNEGTDGFVVADGLQLVPR